jgi:putative methyltransferase (TIGR04325 family)
LFDEIQYSWPLLAGLMLAASKNQGELNVIDFGGSLGSTYFQNRKFLDGVLTSWNVVEQAHFVDCGKREVADDHLSFFESIEDCIRVQKPNVLILGSVLQYLEKPFEFIEIICGYSFPFVIIDRTPTKPQIDKITIQRYQTDINSFTYPCWIFNEQKLCASFQGYLLVEKFDSITTPFK